MCGCVCVAVAAASVVITSRRHYDVAVVVASYVFLARFCLLPYLLLSRIRPSEAAACAWEKEALLMHVRAHLVDVLNRCCLSVVQVVASAIVDKYIGESARVVREMFGYAKVSKQQAAAAVPWVARQLSWQCKS